MIKVMHPNDLYGYDYSVQVINSLKQYWRVQKSFSCINHPKQHNIFVYLNGCDATYKDISGNVIKAESGSLIYAPETSEYVAYFDNFQNNTSCTVGINFRLFDENITPIILENRITVYKNSKFSGFVEKIDNADQGMVSCFAKMKSGLYEIISILGNTENTLEDKYKVIYKGIEHLESGNYNLSIEEIAKMCNVSVSYFRKLFKQYSGVSPIEYRMNTKFQKAKEYLCHTDLNSCEVADLLDFKDMSFFCRRFKKETGLTPLQYKAKYKY